MHKTSKFITVLICALLLAGCAGTQNRHTDPVNDPWEGFNRKAYAFNDSMDRHVVRPIAVGYDKIMPDPLQGGVSKFFRNLNAPVTIINLLLQGAFEKSADTFGRFLLNSTIGLLGFFDPATKAGIPYYDEDLGQTLATWGYKDSRYLVLPVFGPSTVRDGMGLYGDSFVNPVVNQIHNQDLWIYWMARGIDLRAQFLTRDEQLRAAYDPYVLMRDVWMQNRAFQIYDGDPPAADYDLIMDDAFFEMKPVAQPASKTKSMPMPEPEPEQQPEPKPEK